jgi:hypothetical protein
MAVDRYTIVRHRDLDAFISLVNSHLANGWELYGQPYATITSISTSVTTHYQAMVRVDRAILKQQSKIPIRSHRHNGERYIDSIGD